MPRSPRIPTPTPIAPPSKFLAVPPLRAALDKTLELQRRIADLKEDLKQSESDLEGALRMADHRDKESLSLVSSIRTRLEVISIRIPEVEAEFRQARGEIDSHAEALRLEIESEGRAEAAAVESRIIAAISPFCNKGAENPSPRDIANQCHVLEVIRRASQIHEPLSMATGTGEIRSEQLPAWAALLLKAAESHDTQGTFAPAGWDN